MMARARAAESLSVYRLRRLRQWPAGHLGNESGRHDHEAAQCHRRQRRDLRFKIELLHAFLEPRLQVVRAAARFLGVQAGVGFARLLLELQVLGAMVPVADFLREPILDRGAGFVDPGAAPVAHLLQVLRHDFGDGVGQCLLLQDPG